MQLIGERVDNNSVNSPVPSARTQTHTLTHVAHRAGSPEAGAAQSVHLMQQLATSLQAAAAVTRRITWMASSSQSQNHVADRGYYYRLCDCTLSKSMQDGDGEV